MAVFNHTASFLHTDAITQLYMLMVDPNCRGSARTLRRVAVLTGETEQDTVEMVVFNVNVVLGLCKVLVATLDDEDGWLRMRPHTSS